MRSSSLLAVLLLALASQAQAELKLPAIISDHMVLQQNQANPIWGWDAPGTKVTVSFAGNDYPATAGADGKWSVKLAPQPANATAQTLTVTGSSKREIADVLIGEVWICAGQSNMEWKLAGDWNGDLEALASKHPNIRLITVPRVGTQELQNDFQGQWKAATPDVTLPFSAVGFLFGRYIHEILNVPVGLINNAWGGSAAEAWVRRASLEADPRFRSVVESTVNREEDIQSGAARADYEKNLAEWKLAEAAAKAENKPAPIAPASPDHWLAGNARPGNIFSGVVNPTLGFGIHGVIWYQGEANAGRAAGYRDLFPFLIEQWRKEQGQGDFPFYWVQLADYLAEQPAPGESKWAELREAQTLSMRVPHTGQAVIIDLGEGKDIHPRNKHDVAARLARWALVKDYGMTLPYRSPELKESVVQGNKVVVTLDCFGSEARAFDVQEARGFAICGADKVWHPAKGKIIGKDQIEVWSDDVAAPTFVRYAWADNPVCNLYSKDGLPVTPFRTDDFPLTSAAPPSPSSAK